MTQSDEASLPGGTGAHELQPVRSEIEEIERQLALADILRLMRRHGIGLDDVAEHAGTRLELMRLRGEIKPFDPHFSG